MLAENSLISNLDNWIGNISQDDSKQFEENYKDLKTCKPKAKPIKKRQIHKMKYITSSPHTKSATHHNPAANSKGLDIISADAACNKIINSNMNEDYMDGTDENVAVNTEKEMDAYVKDYKDRSMIFKSLGNLNDRPFTLKYNTCPDEDFRNENNKHQTFTSATKAISYGFPSMSDANFSSASKADSNILIQNYASNGSTNISSLSNAQFNYNSPSKHQKFNSDHNLDGNNTISGTRIHYKMITPKHLAFNSEGAKNEADFDMERSKCYL